MESGGRKGQDGKTSSSSLRVPLPRPATEKPTKNQQTIANLQGPLGASGEPPGTSRGLRRPPKIHRFSTPPEDRGRREGIFQIDGR